MPLEGLRWALFTAPAGGEVWDSVGFGVSEYTLVFRRVLTSTRGRERQNWVIVRPEQFVYASHTPHTPQSASVPSPHEDRASEIAQVFVAPICSTLALDGVAYEQFLLRSGVLEESLRILGRLSLTTAQSVETARKQVQALVMAAEVQHIVEKMSA